MKTQHLGFTSWEKTACGREIDQLNEHTDQIVGELSEVNCKFCREAVAAHRPTVCKRGSDNE